MPIRQESAQILMNEAIQELTELNERKKQLENLINNLRKLTGAEPLEVTKESARIQFRKPRIVRKRITHAPQIAEILKQSGVATMRVPEIVAGYRERGLKLTKNGTDVIRTVIKNRPDLFLYKDGNVSLIRQQ